MGDLRTAITPDELHRRIATPGCPVIFDVRRQQAYAEATDVIPTAVWRDHRDAEAMRGSLGPEADVVVYCVHGHEVSQSAAALLRSMGVRARYLDGGIEAYRALGAPLVRRSGWPGGSEERPSRWITRERPKIDRIACPWLIRRFLDRGAVIHFVAADLVADAAAELDAIPFDIPDVAFSHDGDRCSFDAFLARFGIADPALDRLALIVRGADTGRPELAPQAAGLLALSLGLSAIETDDLAMLERGLALYDALYGWCRFAAETHGWPPAGTGAAAGAAGP